MGRFSKFRDFVKKRYTFILLLFTAVYCIYYVNENRWKGINGHEWRTVISADGYGYYGYLPCIFIHHKFDFAKIIESEKIYRPGVPEDEASYTFPTFSNGRSMDKCFVGVAVLMMPFFLIAYFISSILGMDIAGGYSFLFAASISMATLFYMLLGLIFLRKLLKLYSIPEYIICIVLLVGLFGTNLFYYATIEQSLGHVYSFSMDAIFLFYAKKSVDEKKLKYMLLMSLVLGIIVIIRPPNAMCVLMVPFLAGSWKKIMEFMASILHKFKIVWMLVVFTSILFIQLTIWKIETGHWYVWSYPGEGFIFDQFHFIDILFSYRKGWFVYTPLMLIAIAGGLYTAFRQNKFTFLFGLLFFIVVTYILSSWHFWWYGDSYSGRAFVDYYPAFLLMLGMFLASLRSGVSKVSAITLCTLCVGLNQQQIYQFNHFILPYDGMDKQKYWTIFLKNSNLYGGIFDYADTTRIKPIDSLTFKNDFESYSLHGDKNLTTDIAHSCSHSYLINQEAQNTPEFIVDGSKLKSLKNISLYVEFWSFMRDLDNDCKVIVTIKDKDGNSTFWVWRSVKGFVFEKYQWTKAYYVFQLLELKPGDKIHAFVNVSWGSPAYVDDFTIKFCTPK